MDEAEPIDIVLLHGTFARGAEWVRPDSVFCTALGAKLPGAAFHVYGWSGRNAHAARISAGNALSAFVRKLKAANSGRRCFVVAHSHGGNVVLYALSQQSDQNAIDGCIFLGTPFIRTRTREIGAYVGTLTYQLVWLSVYVPSTVLLMKWLGTGNGLVASTVVFFLGVLLAASPWAERFLVKPINANLERFLTRRQQAIHLYLTPASLHTPCLVCQTPGDEAAAWLGALDSTSRLAFIANEYIVQFVNTWPVVIIVGLLGGLIDWIVGERNEFATEGFFFCLPLLIAALVLVVIMSFVLPVVSIVLRAHAAGFGWEGFLGYSLVEVYASRQPAAELGTRIDELQWQPGEQRSRGLRHSGFYQDRKLADCITDWICRPSTQVAQPASTRPSAPINAGLAARLAARRAAATQKPERAGAALSRTHEIFFRCIMLSLATGAAGIVWGIWCMFHPFEDVSGELSRRQLASREVVVAPASFVLGPQEEKGWDFSASRPPNAQSCHLLSHYKADSAQAHIFIGLDHGPDSWEQSTGCGFPGKFAYSGGFGQREVTFSRMIEFGDEGITHGCLKIKNYGKKTTAIVESSLEVLCLR